MIFNFPQDYPFKPPSIAISMNTLHPTDHGTNEGKICCALKGMLCDSWSPVFSLNNI